MVLFLNRFAKILAVSNYAFLNLDAISIWKYLKAEEFIFCSSDSLKYLAWS